MQSVFNRAFATAAMLTVLPAAALAHNPCCSINSPGVPAAPISLDGVDTVGEWAGAVVTNLPDNGLGVPLSGVVKALHKADGIYLQITINDNTTNNNDALHVRFDINNNSAAVEATDFGIEILRRDCPGINCQARWGPASPGAAGDKFDSTGAGWVSIPAANVGVKANSGGAAWVVEVQLPTGASPANLQLATGGVGIYFRLMSASDTFGGSATYTQWPDNVAHTDFSNDPANFADYFFNKASTFPNLTVLGVRRAGVAIENQYKINRDSNNEFEVQVSNPGGPIVVNAPGVRINLYLAAIGLGEGWHRFDDGTVLDADCALASTDHMWDNLAKTNVCSGTAKLPDISDGSVTNADLVGNSAKYTIFAGSPAVHRLDGQSITINGSTSDWRSILQWQPSGAQKPRFDSMTVGGMTYDRAHECMLAEVVYPNDPNTANNTYSVNMRFVDLPEGQKFMMLWSMGWRGFMKYDPNIGKNMFLQLDRRNMGAGWNVELVGAQNTGTDTYQAFIKGTQSLSLQTAIVPPAANSLGTTLKENLVVPPKAGGRVATVAIPSGVAPVYVKVSPGSTLWIANYNFDDNDNQFVDLDGKLFLPPNGPNGLPQHLLGRAIESVEQKFRLTLVPKARLGALVGSWSNFANGDGFLIGDGVQVAVPPGANFLALAINDFIGLYGDNAGTGFRVKIIQRPVAQAGLLQRIEGRVVRSVLAQRPPVAPIPLADVIPRVCVNGYEDTERTAPINGTNFRLFRYVGNVCTGAVNVFPPGRSRKPDPGDPFEGGGPRGCTGRQGNAAAPGMILFVGLCWIGLRTHQGRA